MQRCQIRDTITMENKAGMSESPSSSNNDTMLEVFEDDTDSASVNDDDPWMEQIPSFEEQYDQDTDSDARSNMPSKRSPPDALSSLERDQSSFRKLRAPTAFSAIVPVDIKEGRAPSLEAIEQEAPAKEEKEEEIVGPSFREFALISWKDHKLSLLNDETIFADDGSRQLDAFCLSRVDFMDVFPSEACKDSINPRALSRFCFPDGLRVRIIPRVAMPGAMKKGWVGIKADRCHILVFTNASGKTQHGVAITIRHEIPLKMRSRDHLRQIVRARRQRRSAASLLCRWWRHCAQNLLLKEALVVAKCEDHSIEVLRAELSASELTTLLDTMRIASKSKRRASSIFQWQSRSPTSTATPKQMSSEPKASSMSMSLIKSKEMREAASMTRHAIRRSLASVSEGSVASRTSSETSKLTTLSSIAKKPDHLQTPERVPSEKTSLSSSSSIRKHTPTQPAREISEWAREKGRESYRAMKYASKHGIACIMEKCYVLVGCRPDEHALLLGPLQQLVNAERKEVYDCRTRCNGLPVDEWVDKEREVVEGQQERRHHILEFMLQELRLTREQAAITSPRNYLDFLVGGRHYFKAKLPIPHSSPMQLPLPLPSVGKQWGLSQLLLSIGPDSLVLMLKLLLTERSILVLGENLQEVTTCACSLLELLEPFEWSSVFLPVLPREMLDFIMSPVPFVAGMAVNDYDRVCEVEKDQRTLDAMGNGMSLLNLSTKTLHITSEAQVSKMLSLDATLREQLHCIHARLQHLMQSPSSSLQSFQRFIRSGFAPKETVTLDAACMALETYFTRYCGDLAVDYKAWKQYGTIDVETGKFSFRPEWFMNQLRADQEFQQAMTKTQLFMGYVDDRRRAQLQVEEMRQGEVGQFIAKWVYERWLVWRKRNSPVEV